MVFSLFGEAAPDLWLVVARGGAILAVMLAFRLGARLDGRRAGVAASRPASSRAVALMISSQFVRTMSLGNSEGLLVAFTLWGIERHLDGRYRQAFVLGFLAVAAAAGDLAVPRPLRRCGCVLIDRSALWLVVSARRADARAVVPAGAVGLGQHHARRRPRASSRTPTARRSPSTRSCR